MVDVRGSEYCDPVFTGPDCQLCAVECAVENHYLADGDTFADIAGIAGIVFLALICVARLAGNCYSVLSRRKKPWWVAVLTAKVKTDSVSEVRWLSTTWGGLRRLTGRWVREDRRSDKHATETVERWVHETRAWVIEEELRPILEIPDNARLDFPDDNYVLRYERASVGLYQLFNGERKQQLLTTTTQLHMPSDASWEGWKVVAVTYNALHPPSWNDIYEVSSTGFGWYYKGTVSLHVSKEDTVYRLHDVVQDRLDDALQLEPSLYVHGATVRDEERGVLGQYKLCASAFFEHPAYRKVEGKSYMICRQGAGWAVLLDQDVILQTGEPISLPSRAREGSWSMWANKRDEENGFCRALIPAPSIQCTAGDEGKKLYEEGEKRFRKTKWRDARAQGLRVPGAVQERVSDLRAGDHIFYPTLTGAVYHHAIVTSNENGCCNGIHFNQGVASLGGVKEVSLNDDPRFKNCDTVYCVNRSDYYGGRGGMVRRDGDGRYPLERKPDEIVRTARNILISPDQHVFKATDYNGLLNNCEHFCTYCCTGKRYCYQSEETGRELLTVSGSPLIAAGVVSAAAKAAIALTAAPFALSIIVPIAAASSASVVVASMWRSWHRLYKRAGDVSEANGGSSADDPPS